MTNLLQKMRRCPIFQVKSSEEQKKVITPADVQFSTPLQVKSKKDHHVLRCSLFHANSREEQKKGHQVRRCPIFHANSSEISNFPRKSR